MAEKKKKAAKKATKTANPAAKKAAARPGPRADKADGKAAVLAKIAAMPLGGHPKPAIDGQLKTGH